MLWLWIVLGLLGFGIISYFALTFMISVIIYRSLFVRTDPEKWARHVSWDDPELKTMFAEGEKWGQIHDKYRKTLTINSEGFKLVAEYFDFGFKRTVIIIPGRSESGTYSYYFAEPYRKSGFNVLAVDNRCHGLSEGKYNTLGVKEHKDLINWTNYLHNEFGIDEVIVHGICIGSATAIIALTRDCCSPYLKGMIAEGTYTTFKEIFINQLKKRKKPTWPHTGEVLGLVSCKAGTNVLKYSPINLIDKVKVPVLFLYSKQDSFAKPDKSIELFNKVTSEKRLVWFDKGEHSHIRINNTEKYDSSIEQFLKDFYK